MFKKLEQYFPCLREKKIPYSGIKLNNWDIICPPYGVG